MGYETRHELSWTPQPNRQSQPNCPHTFDTPFCPLCGKPKGVIAPDKVIGDYIEANENMSYALGRDGSSNDSCKWYDHEEDMRAMSQAIPDVVFKLHGEGEENDDIWDSYYLNGKSQTHKARIVIDPLDEKAWK